MTKLDRAITNESNLKMLDEFYLARNITASDLLKVMEEVHIKAYNILIRSKYFKSFFLDGTLLLGHDYRL